MDKYQIDQIISKNHFEISETAARVGVDFDASIDLVDGSNGMHYAKPLDKKDRQKVMVGSSAQGKTLVINFFTYKHGQRTETWKYTLGSERPLVSRSPSAKRSWDSRKPPKRGLNAQEKAHLNAKYIADYEACDTWVDDHPYLEAKGLVGLTKAKLMSDYLGEFIAIPMTCPNGSMAGLQRIYTKKDEDEGWVKRYTPGVAKRGAYLIVGNLSEPHEEVGVCEGWADAVTLHAATGLPVYCAFDCQNMARVVNMLLKTKPCSQIRFAADNDQWKPEHGNAGVRAALEISYHKKIKARKPSFKHLDLDEGDTPTDFNDLFQIAGLDEVKRQFLEMDLHTIVRAPRRAFEYQVLYLRYVASRARPKQLSKIIASGLRRDLALEQLIKLLAPVGMTPDEVKKAYDFCMRGNYARVRSIHKSSKRSLVSDVEIVLERENHGGYLIKEGQNELIKDLDGIIIIKTPMGSGKTERLIKQSMAETKSGAYLAHRVSLVEEACQRLGIMSYRGAEELDILGNKKVGVCVNSLNHPKFGRGAWFDQVETVYIDEASKVLDHLCGSTIEDHDGVMQTFTSMLNIAPRVVLCDADASDHLINTLRSMAPERTIYLADPTDDAPMDHITVKLTCSFSAGYDKAFRDALSGKKVLIATDSKKEVKKIARKLRKHCLNVLAVHSESRVLPEVEAWIKSPGRESEKYDVVVYNSCVDSGISIVTEHFDETVGLFRGIVTPDAIKQMMGRNRKARDWFIALDPIYKTRFSNTMDETKQALSSSHIKSLWDSTTKAPIPSPELSEFDRVKIMVDHRKALMCKDYFLTFQIMLEQDGYVVDRLYTEEDLQSEFDKEMKDLGADIENEFIKTITETRAPSSSRYRKLKESYAVSEEEYSEIVRFEIEAALCKKDLESCDVSFWIKGGRKQLFLFEVLCSDLEDLRSYDRCEAENGRVKSLSLRKSLLTKGDILQGVFTHLKIDRDSAEGDFSHVDARAFVEWILENNNRRLNWNHHRLGPFLGRQCPPDPMKFVQETLKGLCLKTNRRNQGKKRLSVHSIDQHAWQTMEAYLANRKAAGKAIWTLPDDYQNQPVKDTLEEDSREEETPFEPYVDLDGESPMWCSCGNEVSDLLSKWGIEDCQDCFSLRSGEEGDDD